MISPKHRCRQLCPIAFLLVVLQGTVAAASVDVLRIGTSGALAGNTDASKEKAGLETLHSFIKDETGLNNEIVRQKNWQDLVDKMAAGQLHLGVFQGYEFAWAQEKHADLKPLALAINTYRYPVALVMTQRDNTAKDFAGLQGQSLSLPVTNQGFLRLYVERQSDACGKKMEDYFSKISTPDDAEDALDDVVDGAIQVVVVDRTSLEAYKRRKPGRFNQLKEVARSRPFPPAVVAYYGSALDEATLRSFRDGLLGAAGKEKGQTLLTLFRLTGFEAVPDDFGPAAVETRKAYPAPNVRDK